ncbi:FecR family protein [Pedobacter caeni]|uniref:FecR family protein n=1 Tax=Pedobacter caeni TaxID=288992 RepID=A0A1M4Z7Q7_9SPHI|nr:FecR domain-containing protein [Pedobacter caeni]SHF13626.1 FecR family protein [Pedobacter caeni]
MNPDIEALLDRYLKKETSPVEDRLIEKWLTENEIADPAWQHLNRTAKDQWLSEVLLDIKTSIKGNEPKVILKESKKYLWYKIAGVAAVLLLVFGLYLSRPELNSTVISADQKKQITLSDGTRVWLNAGAELKYPESFTDESRTVSLSGEAYFDVKHDPHKPFLIHTGKVLTTVLGTAFNIKEDLHRHTIEVTVTSGKVSVTDDGKLLGILTGNQQVSLDLSSRKSVKKTVDANTVIAWQHDDLLFDDITLADAAMQLQQRFHIKITFNNDQLKKCRFSGSTFKDDQLDKILDAITGFNNATWKRNADGNIIIYGEGCN